MAPFAINRDPESFKMNKGGWKNLGDLLMNLTAHVLYAGEDADGRSLFLRPSKSCTMTWDYVLELRFWRLEGPADGMTCL